MKRAKKRLNQFTKIYHNSQIIESLRTLRTSKYFQVCYLKYTQFVYSKYHVCLIFESMCYKLFPNTVI